MKTNAYEVKIVKQCPNCGWRIFDKLTPTSGIIELKCPNCRRVVEVDLSYRVARPRVLPFATRPA